LVFKTNSNWTNGNAVEAMRIDSTGNVGIGTNAPGSPLDVTFTSNTAYDSSNTLVSGQTARISNLSTTAGIATTLMFNPKGGGGGNGLATISGVNTATGSTAITFGTRDAGGNVMERIRITSAGNVLIGTTAATGTLNGSSQPRLIVGSSGAGGFGAIYSASGGGTTYFPVNNGFGYRVTIWSTQSSINAKIGVYIFVGLNKGAGYNPVILTVNTVNSPDWSFSYALLNSNDCTVGVNDGGGNQGTRVVVENLGNV
jgi:hypothetical protein